ncbi:MAG: DEAD/DEAH box helicase [Verrucomicrobium sp.]|nr:DEAD/DEAH box helicase [Verrucomicrobium sp.]
MAAITRDFLAKVGGWPVLNEASSLQKAGRVAAVSLDGAFLTGQLRLTTGNLTARLKISDRLSEVENLCSCRQARERGTVCPHVVALGLEWIERQNGKASPPPSASVPDPIAPATPSRLLSRAEAPAGTPVLHATLLLPLAFAEAWRSGKMRVILEAASVPGEPSLPWEAALKKAGAKPHGPLAVQEGMLDALRVLERQGGLSGMAILSAAAFDAFFRALRGVSGAWLGKKTNLAVRAATQRPFIQVTPLPDGRFRAEAPHAEAPGEWLPSPGGRWRFDSSSLEEHPPLPPSLQRLGNQPLILSREELPHLLQLPSLAQGLDIRLGQEIAWEEAVPTLAAEIDGDLKGLSCRLEARYGDHRILLSSPSFSAPAADAPGRWLPDPARPLCYLGRSPAAENRARAALAEAGFGPKPGERQILGGEEAVIAFLANHLPRWQREWQVELSPRLAALLGSCRVVEPRVHLQSGGDWLQVTTEFRSQDGAVQLTPGEVQQLLQTGRTHRRLPSGQIALLPSGAIENWREVLADCDPAAGLGEAKIAKRDASYLESALRDTGLLPVSWKAPSRLVEAAPPPCPPHLEKILRPYQKEGVTWFHRLEANGLAGILADEMGLGKTVQVLAYLASRKRGRPSLVIAPTSLLVNWQREAERFAPELKTLVLHGADRHEAWARAAQCDLLITSYALLRRDVEKHQALDFDAVILDEAQAIKNRFSQNAQAVKAVGARAAQRLILTGTPLENSLLDLWSMFDFLMPGYLGAAPLFRERYEVPIVKHQDAPALKRLRQRIHPFLLRRTKADVAQEIPPKLESVTYCDLSAEQRQVYQSVLEAGRKEVFEQSGKQGSPGKRTMAMLTALTRLRQACCHLQLLPLEPDAPWKEPSAKVDALFEILEEARAGGHRLLVFSQFVKLLKLIGARLEKEEIPYAYLDGATENRQAVIDRFQSGSEPLFLISLKAGGAGLNLTAADTVVHCDPWWNPAVEEQATARAHRMGQTRVVTSYKLIARGTVEEKILQLQERKKELVAQTLLGEEAFLANLTQTEWEELLS